MMEEYRGDDREPGGVLPNFTIHRHLMFPNKKLYLHDPIYRDFLWSKSGN